jgi:hypothetical protein
MLGLKAPSYAGTTHLAMSPLEFTQRLAALVPYPRRLTLGSSRTTSCERQLRGEQFGALSVAEGSSGVLQPANRVTRKLA